MRARTSADVDIIIITVTGTISLEMSRIPTFYNGINIGIIGIQLDIEAMDVAMGES